MSDLWGPVIIALLGGGGLGAAATLIKARADARAIRATADQTVVQTALAEGGAEDDHWRLLIETQTTALIAPLREEVERLMRRVEELDQQVSRIRRRYQLALDVIRAYVRYSALLVSLLAGAGLSAPPPPPIPSDIDEDF